MKTPINIELSSGKVDFLMDFDPTCPADQCTVTAFNASHGCEPELVHLLLRILRPGDLVVDGGANVGFFTMLMAKLVGPTGRVIAFEPDDNNIHKIAVNANLNKFENVTLVSNPLWDKLEQVTFHMAEQSGFSGLVRTPLTVGSVQKQAITLDAYLGAAHTPRLLKLDLEGAELRALMGGKRLLHEMPYIACEVCGESLQRFGDSAEQLRIFLSDWGYAMWLLHANGQFPTYLPLKVDIRTNRANLNVLFATSDMVAEAWPHEDIPLAGY